MGSWMVVSQKGKGSKLKRLNVKIRINKTENHNYYTPLTRQVEDPKHINRMDSTNSAENDTGKNGTSMEG